MSSVFLLCEIRISKHETNSKQKYYFNELRIGYEYTNYECASRKLSAFSASSLRSLRFKKKDLTAKCAEFFAEGAEKPDAIISENPFNQCHLCSYCVLLQNIFQFAEEN